jgi:hypothetical protein
MCTAYSDIDIILSDPEQPSQHIHFPDHALTSQAVYLTDSRASDMCSACGGLSSINTTATSDGMYVSLGVAGKRAQKHTHTHTHMQKERKIYRRHTYTQGECGSTPFKPGKKSQQPTSSLKALQGETILV